VRRHHAAGVDDSVELPPGERRDPRVGGPVAAQRLDTVGVRAGQPSVEGRDLVSPRERRAHDRASDERRAADDQ
jgi:hypothetical protein